MRAFAQKQNHPQKGFFGLEQAPAAASRPVHHTHPLQHLQRTMGNQAVQRLLLSQRHGQRVEHHDEDAAPGAPPLPAAGEAETALPDAEAATGTGAKQAATVPRTVVRGPREMWYFDGETPSNYTVSSVLSTNKSGGLFHWSVSPQLRLSLPTDATPTATADAPSGARSDAWIRVQHTDTTGVRSTASYRLTVLAPDSLTHLRDVDNTDATWGYLTEIHYSIQDQLGTVLPRNVPINEQWTGAVVADFAGMNWPRGPEGAATVNPADWHDRVGGVGAGGVPAPVAPGHASAGVPICHWPGDWRVGSLTIGNGRRVRSVTWSKSLGFARHT